MSRLTLRLQHQAESYKVDLKSPEADQPGRWHIPRASACRTLAIGG